jgi:arabinofuranosyltransferase
MLNRLDAGFLVLPAFVAAVRRLPWRSQALAAALGFVPLAAWEVFSLIYYGFLFPNTAYAKLSTGISSAALLRQGVYYYLDLLRTDTVTFATIAAALVLTARTGRASLPLALGIALYLVYILRIGGDFMAGRFFSGPFLLAVVALCRARWPAGWMVQTAIVAALVLTRAAVLSVDGGVSRSHGITDQRRLYSEATRLVTQRTAPVDQGSWAVRGKAFRERGARVVEFGVIGMAGFFAGPSVHFVDPFADPLLARRPADPRSRIGHFERRIPAGYLASIRSGRNRIENARIARYYDHIVLVTQGPIWSWDRWRAIVRLNLFERTM